jgi:hypothetical protein
MAEDVNAYARAVVNASAFAFLQMMDVMISQWPTGVIFLFA